MSELLKLAHLADRDHVADVKIGGARVESAIHPQGSALSIGFHQPLTELGFHRGGEGGIAVFGSLHEQGHLLIDVWFGHGGLLYGMDSGPTLNAPAAQRVPSCDGLRWDGALLNNSGRNFHPNSLSRAQQKLLTLL